MRQKMYLAILVVMVSVGMLSSCSEEQVVDKNDDLTLETRVMNSQIIPGNVPSDQNPTSYKEVRNGAYICIPIPSKDGYLKFEIDSKEEKHEILSLVAARFKKEFEESNNDNSNSRSVTKSCGDWKPTIFGDIASRECYELVGFIYVSWTEYCECGYCC